MLSMVETAPKQPNPIDFLFREKSMVEGQIQEISARIEGFQDEQRRLREKLAWINNLIAESTGEARPMSDRPITRKNINLHNAWIAVQRVLQSPPRNEGSNVPQLREAVEVAVRDLKDPTFRSYLHRFKAEGRIKKLKSGQWVLVEGNQEKGG